MLLQNLPKLRYNTSILAMLSRAALFTRAMGEDERGLERI